MRGEWRIRGAGAIEVLPLLLYVKSVSSFSMIIALRDLPEKRVPDTSLVSNQFANLFRHACDSGVLGYLLCRASFIPSASTRRSQLQPT